MYRTRVGEFRMCPHLDQRKPETWMSSLFGGAVDYRVYGLWFVGVRMHWVWPARSHKLGFLLLSCGDVYTMFSIRSTARMEGRFSEKTEEIVLCRQLNEWTEDLMSAGDLQRSAWSKSYPPSIHRLGKAYE